MIQLSTELYDQIVSQFEFSNRDEVRYIDQGFQILQRFAAEGRGTSDTQTLCNLRLTSRPFHQAATRILFRSTGVTWGPQSSSLDRFILAGGNSIPIVSNIRRVRFDFGDDMDDVFIQSSDGNKNTSNPTRWLIDKLPRLLSHLTQMSSFEFLSRGYGSDYNGSEGSAPNLDLELWQTINYKIVEGLTSANFDALTDLRLSLPCTYDFVSVSKALPEDMCNRLKILYLEITDATGPGGSKDYLRWADEETDGDEDFPLSNLQKWHPNVDREIDNESELDHDSESDSDGHEERFKPTVNNESGVFDLVSRCPNLETLGLASTHVLNGDLLSWNPASQGLKYLYLLRIKISAENLIKLLSPAEHLTSSFSTAFGLWFEDIELTAGSWAQVCKHLLQCPKLNYCELSPLPLLSIGMTWNFRSLFDICPRDLTYSRDGQSIHLRVFSGRLWEDCRAIWSEREEEESGLQQVLLMLIDRAGGKENYPNENLELMGVYADSI